MMIKVKNSLHIIFVLLICVSPKSYPASSLNWVTQSCINIAKRTFSCIKQHPKIAIATAAVALVIRYRDKWLAETLYRKHTWRSWLLTMLGATVPEKSKPELERRLIRAIRQNESDEAEMYLDAGIEIPKEKAANCAQELLDALQEHNIKKAILFASAGVSLAPSTDQKIQTAVSNLILTSLTRSYKESIATKQVGPPEILGTNNRAAIDDANVLISYGGTIDTNNQDATQLFHLATLEGNKTVALALINAGINVNATTQNGDTAMHIAARHGWSGIIQSLLEHSARINIQNNLGETPLLKAVIARNDETTRFLLENNADATIAAANGVTPLAYVTDNGLTDIAQFITHIPAH